MLLLIQNKKGRVNSAATPKTPPFKYVIKNNVVQTHTNDDMPYFYLTLSVYLIIRSVTRGTFVLHSVNIPYYITK